MLVTAEKMAQMMMCRHFHTDKYDLLVSMLEKKRLRGEGKRPVQAYLPFEYPVVVRMKLDPNTRKYIFTKVITEYNHTTSAGEFKHYSTNRRLADEERDNIKTLIVLQVETKTLRILYEKIQSKDVSNIRHKHQKEKEGGGTKGQIVAGVLSGLVVKKQATTSIDTDDTIDVKLIYTQTGEMKEHFRKYPDIRGPFGKFVA